MADSKCCPYRFPILLKTCSRFGNRHALRDVILSEAKDLRIQLVRDAPAVILRKCRPSQREGLPTKDLCIWASTDPA
jgi:hypothetical protein